MDELTTEQRRYEALVRVQSAAKILRGWRSDRVVLVPDDFGLLAIQLDQAAEFLGSDG